MNLGEVIHDRWAADATLNGLLAATKVMTGTNFAVDPAFPYATITAPGGPPGERYNDGAATNVVTVRIAVYHDMDNYDACKAIADRVQVLFDSKDFALGGSDKVLDIRASIPQEIQDQETSVWTFVCDLDCRVYLATGV